MKSLLALLLGAGGIALAIASYPLTHDALLEHDKTGKSAEYMPVILSSGFSYLLILIAVILAWKILSGVLKLVLLVGALVLAGGLPLIANGNYSFDGDKALSVPGITQLR